MRVFPLAAAVAAVLLPAAPAFASDPTMPLSQVQAGMRCTGYSVIRGTEISSFDVQVLDVAAGEGTGGSGRILFEASGPAIDATGLGPGFSGSPIYCPGGDGVARVIGAVSESINEYGGKVALATPIEAILGTPVDVPGRPSAAATPAGATAARARTGAPARRRVTLSPGCDRARERAADGLAADRQRRERAGGEAPHRGGREGRSAGADGPARAARVVPRADAATRFGGRRRVLQRRHPHQLDRYRRLRRRRSVWVFGHALEGVGRRALLLQDAYVFRVVNNPLQLGQIGATYKLASSGHDLGTVSSDGFSAVAGRTGGLPHTVPVQAITQDTDSKTMRTSPRRLPTRRPWTCRAGARGRRRRAAGGRAGRRRGARQHARAADGRDVRAHRPRGAEKPLRFCNRYVGLRRPGRRRQHRQRRAHRRRQRSRRRALDDRRLHGFAAPRHRRQRPVAGPPRRRPGVHAHAGSRRVPAPVSASARG